MKKICFLLLFIYSSIQSQDLKKVDHIIHSYHSIKSAEDLTKRIDYDFPSKIEKVRAIFSWIALNIEYDNTLNVSNFVEPPEVYIYFNEDDLKRRLEFANNEFVSKTIKSKRAVCKGIAFTFQKICNLLQIENDLIKGYMKETKDDINYLAKTKNHVWNAVKIDTKWFFFDVTAAIDNRGKHPKPNYLYFDISARKLNLTH